VYYVDPANGNDSYKGTSPKKPMKTITAAYAACTANQHDVVALIGDASSITLSAALTWAKDFTHLVGLCAPTNVGQRSRIFQLSTLTAASPLINITADGCIFKDLYIFQGVDDATSLVNVQVTGGRNYFENVHFAGGGHATQAIDGGASLKLAGAEECLFRGCTIGVDTIAAATGMAGVIVDTDAKRCTFDACNFTMYAGHAGAKFVEIADSAGFDRYLIFRDCLFINDSSVTTMTEAFTIPSGMGSATHRILMKGCGAVGVTDWESNDRGIMYLDSGTITAGGNAGLLQASAAT
jgi:hypothetical protein